MSAVFHEDQKRRSNTQNILSATASLGARVLAFENGQLLTQGEIFDEEASLGAKQPNEYADPRQHKAKHGLHS